MPRLRGLPSEGASAAYKACDLVSQLVQGGPPRRRDADPRAPSASSRPLAFAALTHRAVVMHDDTLEVPTKVGPGGPADHLTRPPTEADLLVIAPCTANLIGKLAHGIADEIVSTTFLGAGCPVLLAPAMNQRMWAAKRVVANVATLREDGVQFVGPASGYLAEGDEGPGRMSEPADILAAIAGTNGGSL